MDYSTSRQSLILKITMALAILVLTIMQVRIGKSIKSISIPHHIVHNESIMMHPHEEESMNKAGKHDRQERNSLMWNTSVGRLPRFIANTSTRCSFIIDNKLVDHHYETLESIALRYPLPWEKLNLTNKCEYSGINSTDPINVDFFLIFAYRPYEAKEAWGWKKYFDEHLQGSVRRRSVDGRYIMFRSIVGVDLAEDPVDWSSYSAIIQATCCRRIRNSIKWLRKDKRQRNYCILHGIKPIPPALASRICYLNPQHHPQCWFIPADYPAFPQQIDNGNQSINVCIPDKNATVITEALRILRPLNLKVLIYGRFAEVPVDFKDKELAHYVVLKQNLTNYLEFQESISKCHIMVPLLDRESTPKYFLGAEEYGRLSGYVSQMIGYRIPSIIHSSVVEVYRNELTARYYEYNTTNSDESNFVAAFRAALQSYGVVLNGSAINA